jgi:hypothetical protein
LMMLFLLWSCFTNRFEQDELVLSRDDADESDDEVDAAAAAAVSDAPTSSPSSSSAVAGLKNDNADPVDAAPSVSPASFLGWVSLFAQLVQATADCSFADFLFWSIPPVALQELQ